MLDQMVSLVDPSKGAMRSNDAVENSSVTNLVGKKRVGGNRLSIEPSQKNVDCVVVRLKPSAHSSIIAHLLISGKSREDGDSGAVSDQQTQRHEDARPRNVTQRAEHVDVGPIRLIQCAELGDTVTGSGNDHIISPGGK